MTETPAKASWLAVLLSYAGRCRGKMAVSLLCSVASVAAGLVPFYAVYRIIDEVIAPAPDGGAVLAWVVRTPLILPTRVNADCPGALTQIAPGR